MRIMIKSNDFRIRIKSNDFRLIYALCINKRLFKSSHKVGWLSIELCVKHDDNHMKKEPWGPWMRNAVNNEGSVVNQSRDRCVERWWRRNRMKPGRLGRNWEVVGRVRKVVDRSQRGKMPEIAVEWRMVGLQHFWIF